MRFLTKAKRALVFAGVWVLSAAALAGCPVRGTDEAAEFASCGSSQVSFGTLNGCLLTPMRCIECHSEMSSEAGLRQYVVPGESRRSRLFEVIERGEMPKGGPRLSDRYVKLVAAYIDGLPAGGPIPTPTPRPLPLEPTFASLQQHLVAVSCRGCHGVNQPSPGRRINLTVYEVVKANAAEILTRVTSTDEFEVMPPPDANRPAPRGEVIQALRDWISLGFPRDSAP